MFERLNRLGIRTDRLPLSGWSLDAAFAVLGATLVAGVTWDFNVHINGINFSEEGFFTEPHIMFYSAFVAIACLLTVATLSNRRDGASWVSAVPVGYRYAMLGVLLFALGGPMDAGWHTAFGAEDGAAEGLTSPTHLLLATGGAIFLSAPLRAALVRGVDSSLKKQLPMLFSAGAIAITISAFSMYGNPFYLGIGGEALGSASEVTQGQGVLSVILFTAILVGVSLTVLQRFELAPGAFVFLFTLVGLPFTARGGFVFLPAMILTGIVADLLYQSLDPRSDRTLQFRAFAAAIPLVLFSGYYATYAYRVGIDWSVHVWTGSIVVSVLVGVLVSYLVQPYAGIDGAADAAATGHTAETTDTSYSRTVGRAAEQD